jgi:hypothetical protein
VERPNKSIASRSLARDGLALRAFSIGRIEGIAVTDAVISTERFDMGRVISRTFGVIGRNFPVFFGLSLVLAGAPAALVGLAQSYYYVGRSTESEAVAPVVILLVGMVVRLVSSSFLQAALVNSAVADLSGGRARFGSSLATGVRFFLPLLGVAILGGIGMAFGFLLLVVPGLILAVMWCVTTPAVVVDRTGVTGSFSRSLELTRGHRWIIFALLVIYTISVYGFMITSTFLGGVILGAASTLGGTSSVFIYLALWGALQATIVAMIGCAGVAALYVELRQIKEGVGAESIAAVFA